MANNKLNTIPAEGLQGLIQNWRADSLAAFTVALVALPLGLGIALASKVPPIAGVISAVIGGIVPIVYRGGHLGVCGPAAGLIVVVITTVEAFDGQYEHALGVFCVAGLLQLLFGLFRLGKFGDFFPNAVINGMLAAIGIMIISKQAHVALGKTAAELPNTVLEALLAIPQSMLSMNLVVGLMALLSLVILSIHPKVKYKVVRLIPAPVWVLVFVIPLALLFQLHQAHVISFLGQTVQLGKHLLIQIPANPLAGITFPSFQKINEPIFWVLSITIALISSIETLIISKAVDKLDPYRRKTNFNKELIGIGLASTVAAMIGGLPIITVIARSSVGVQNGAKTKWVNFYHGLLLLLLVFFFEKALQRIPMAALAAILVYTGYKLSSPKVVIDTYKKGIEEVLVFMSTVLVTLIYGILWGIFAGILCTLLVHFIKVEMKPKQFVMKLFQPIIKVSQKQDNRVYIEIGGLANFFVLLKLSKALEQIHGQQHIVINFTNANFVDRTVLVYIHGFAEDYEAKGGVFEIVGLGKHGKLIS